MSVLSHGDQGKVWHCLIHADAAVARSAETYGCDISKLRVYLLLNRNQIGSAAIR
jgi:hypothetical protein